MLPYSWSMWLWGRASWWPSYGSGFESPLLGARGPALWLSWWIIWRNRYHKISGIKLESKHLFFVWGISCHQLLDPWGPKTDIDTFVRGDFFMGVALRGLWPNTIARLSKDRWGKHKAWLIPLSINFQGRLLLYLIILLNKCVWHRKHH